MAKVQHTCTGCVPIDASILEVYIALDELDKRANANEDERIEAEGSVVIPPGEGHPMPSSGSGRLYNEAVRQHNEDVRQAQEEERWADYREAEGTEAESEAGDGSRWGDYKAAEHSRDEARLEVEGTSESEAGDGTRWGAYKAAEAARDTARENAEGTAASAAGDGTRWGAYKTAEAERNTAAENVEGTAASTAGDGSRWGAYKSAEAARDAERLAAEGTSSSTAGDGTRWGAFKTDESARNDAMAPLVGSYACDTAASTAAKTVSATGYVLGGGGAFKVKFTYANSASSPTLNVNSTGAKAIVFNGSPASATNSWGAGEVVEFYYDPTYNSNAGAFIGRSTVISISPNTNTGGYNLQVGDVLLKAINAGYQFMGFALPYTNPGTPDQPVAYLAFLPGVYANFGGIKVTTNMGMLIYNGTWEFRGSVLPTVTTYLGWINVNNVVAQTSEYTVEIIPINPGDNIEIEASYLRTSYYSFLQSFGVERVTVAGSPYINSIRLLSMVPSSGTGRVTLQANQKVNIVAPSDANYIAVPRVAVDGDFSPNYVKVNNKLFVFSNASVLAQTSKDCGASKAYLEKAIGTVDDFEIAQYVAGWMVANGQADPSAENRNVGIIPVSGGDNVEVCGIFNKTCYYAFITNYVVGGTPPRVTSFTLSSGASRVLLQVGQKVSVVAPSDANYIVVSRVSVDDDYSPNYVKVGNKLYFLHSVPSFEKTINDYLFALKLDTTFVRNVKEFGAVGDGVVDDTSALQSAFDLGGEIIIPNGTYKITNPLVFKGKSHIKMAPGAIIKQTNTSARCVMRSYNVATDTAYNGISNIVIEGGTLDANGGVVPSCSCLAMAHCLDVQIRNVKFKGVSAGMHGVDMAGCKNVIFDSCKFSDWLTEGHYGECIQIDGVNSLQSYPYVNFSATASFFDDAGCVNIEVCGCDFELNNVSPAVGNHNYSNHKRINIHDNFIKGSSESSADRGAIVFDIYSGYTGQNNHSTSIMVHDNIFDGCNICMSWDQNGTTKAFVANNVYVGCNSFSVGQTTDIVFVNNQEF